MHRVHCVRPEVHAIGSYGLQFGVRRLIAWLGKIPRRTVDRNTRSFWSTMDGRGGQILNSWSKQPEDGYFTHVLLRSILYAPLVPISRTSSAPVDPRPHRAACNIPRQLVLPFDQASPRIILSQPIVYLAIVWRDSCFNIISTIFI